ncbi:histidinol-phosphate aminotransferase [Methanosalsum zhilinae DSM 4017]|uniref:Histidinol-phosphate aminotransferase n=1 Tax=Methanosalsum zhilinae (strain DSM 4017 / NBRC 107636 / OCM 62 / WeN5) TaxID=679901 RepID=F7XPZ4_METZD|nr:histidinol-phosphate transaminase [Methanosalsum zhilinae]AEH61521.1 histidinol-phosphate aminotransferase [Methanosalsum zhilinae DSM 4017]
MSRPELIKEGIESISEYVPGRSIDDIAELVGLHPDRIIKLGSNENPLGPSEKAVSAMVRHASDISIYPSADAGELVKALSEYTGLPGSNIVASGPGMDGLIDSLLRLVINPGDRVIISTPTFSYYEIASRACGGVPVFVPRDQDFQVDADAVIDAVTPDTKMIFLCSPNNPSGNLINEVDVKRILESTGGFVFIDEAYVEFADRNLMHLIRDYDNLIIGRTFSKAFGLAGLRIGYGIMPEWLKSQYMKAATPFNVSSAAIAAGIAALSDPEHLRRSIDLVEKGRMFLKENIDFRVHDSHANFVLVDVSPYSASKICSHLLQKGIIVRDCTSFRDAGESLVRITVGKEEQNRKVVEAFADFLNSRET